MRTFLVFYLIALFSTSVSSFISASKQPTRASFLGASGADAEGILPIPTREVVKKVAVAGATGRTGKLVVQELLNRNVQVLGMVRSLDRAKETFPKANSDLAIVKVDLTNEKEIEQALKGCDAVIWCATGFSDADTDIFERLKRLFGIALAPKQSIDSVGIPSVAKCMLNQVNGSQQDTPKVVMMSSAGVTRSQWDEAKKEAFRGCADIPIVRLNPFGILNIKAESEEKLRQSGK
jgi:hypothetical protein